MSSREVACREAHYSPLHSRLTRNICSRSKREYGFFDTVCMFDADLTIDGLPYRALELEYGGASFGEKLAKLYLFGE